jgi:uncharacterized membrane protein YfcA
MDYAFAAIALGFCATLLVGLSKTGVPGAAIPALLMMAEAFPGNEKLSVGAILPMLLLGDLFAVGYYRRHAQWNRLVGLFPYVAAGMVPGVVVLALVDDAQFKVVLGSLVLGLLAVEVGRQWYGWTHVPHRRWFVATMGILAGFGTAVGNAAGPVMSIYLISRGMRKEHFMGTWAWFFLIVNAVKSPVFGTLGVITAETLRYDLLVFPGVVAGALLGRRVFAVIPQRVFNPLVLLLAGLAALRMVGVSFWI